MLYYTFTVCVICVCVCVCVCECKKVPPSGPQNRHLNYVIRSVAQHKISFIYVYTYIFKNRAFPTVAVQQKQHVDSTGFVRILSRLIGMFVRDILQVPSGRIEIRSGCITPT